MIAQTAANVVEKDAPDWSSPSESIANDVIIVRQFHNAEVVSPQELDALSINGDCADSIDINELKAELGNPFKGFIFATLFSVPVWALLIWWLL